MSAKSGAAHVVSRLLDRAAMSWEDIKIAIRSTHVHAREYAADELRLVLSFEGTEGERVPLVISRVGDAAVVVAMIGRAEGFDTHRALAVATSLGGTLAVLGPQLCVRSLLELSRVEATLQATARTALRVRRASRLPARTDLGAFAFAL